MDYENRTQTRGFHAGGDTESLLNMLAGAIRSGAPHVRQICQVGAALGDKELESLAGKGDFPFSANTDLIAWVVDGGFVSGFRQRMWVSECLERNVKFTVPAVQEALTFARDFAEGHRSWQELFGMAQTVESINVPRLYPGEMDGLWASRLRHTPQTYMTYAVASALSSGSLYMKRALRLSRMSAAATVRRQPRGVMEHVQIEEHKHQLDLLYKHLRAEAASWVR